MKIPLRYLNLWKLMNANNFMTHCKYVGNYCKSLNTIIKIYENLWKPWKPTNIYDNPYKIIKTNQWSAMTIHENRATFFKIYNNPSKQYTSMNSYDNKWTSWKSMKINDHLWNLWKSLKINYNPWQTQKPMLMHYNIWTLIKSMKLYDNQWKS